MSPPRCLRSRAAAPVSPPSKLAKGAAAAPVRQLARPSDSLGALLLLGTHDSCSYRIDPAHVSRSALRALGSGLVRRATAAAIRDVSQTQDLDVLAQLQAGVRFLDLRVSKLSAASAGSDNRFWTVHGMAVCVPFEDVLAQINTFHDMVSASAAARQPDECPIPVVSVVRPLDLSPQEQEELAILIRTTLKGGIFSGSAKELHVATLASLPRNIVAGLASLSSLPPDWGHDAFTDTYKSDVKTKFLLDYMAARTPRQQRDDWSVIGWTVTPQTSDVVLRILSLGIRPRTLKIEALKMDRLLPDFIKDHGQLLSSVANVIFCDYADTAFANAVIELSNTTLLATSQS